MNNNAVYVTICLQCLHIDIFTTKHPPQGDKIQCVEIGIYFVVEERRTCIDIK